MSLQNGTQPAQDQSTFQRGAPGLRRLTSSSRRPSSARRRGPSYPLRPRRPHRQPAKNGPGGRGAAAARRLAKKERTARSRGSAFRSLLLLLVHHDVPARPRRHVAAATTSRVAGCCASIHAGEERRRSSFVHRSFCHPLPGQARGQPPACAGAMDDGEVKKKDGNRLCARAAAHAGEIAKTPGSWGCWSAHHAHPTESMPEFCRQVPPPPRPASAPQDQGPL